MNSHAGLFSVWELGDWITRTGFLLLLAMSLASWIVIAIKALDVSRSQRLSRRAQAFCRIAGRCCPGNPGCADPGS